MTCPHCDFTRKLSMAHRPECPAMDDSTWPDRETPHCQEIVPGLWVGDVCARVGRWDLVVGILSEENLRWIGDLAGPPCEYILLMHEDRTPGLLAKCAAAWDRMSAVLSSGRVLVHCHQGASRSVAVAAGWLILQGRTAQEAVDLLVAKRPQAMHLSRVFQEELVALEGRRP